MTRYNINYVKQWSTFIGGPNIDIISDVATQGRFLYVGGWTYSDYGQLIDATTGQQTGSAFPLWEFDDVPNTDYWQQYYSCPVNNSPADCTVPNDWFNADAFVTVFYDNCGAPCFRIAENNNSSLTPPTSSLLSVFPNPTSNVCQIICRDTTADVVLFLYNYLGQLKSEKRIPTNEISTLDVSDLPSGIYLLKAGSNSTKIIKQ